MKPTKFELFIFVAMLIAMILIICSGCGTTRQNTGAPIREYQIILPSVQHAINMHDERPFDGDGYWVTAEGRSLCGNAQIVTAEISLQPEIYEAELIERNGWLIVILQDTVLVFKNQ